MAVISIDRFIDSLTEDWMRSIFIDRLENARLLLDDETFGDTEGANIALGSFLQLSTAQRAAEIERLRVRNTAVGWAKNATVEDINSLVTALRAVRDAIAAAQQTPTEPEETGETGE